MRNPSEECLLAFYRQFRLEWEIVCATAFGCRSCWLSWREWSCCTTSWSGRLSWGCSWSGTHWREWRARLHASHSTCYGIRVYTLNIPSTHTVEPTTLVFVSIQIEGNQEFLPTLDIELCQAIGTKHVKTQFLRILLVSLDNERLSLPLSSCRDTASFRQNGDNLSL